VWKAFLLLSPYCHPSWLCDWLGWCDVSDRSKQIGSAPVVQSVALRIAPWRVDRSKEQLLLQRAPDAVPPIHAVSYHVATDNLQPIATRRKKARGMLLVDIGCSSKRAALSVSYYNEIAAAILVAAVVSNG